VSYDRFLVAEWWDASSLCDGGSVCGKLSLRRSGPEFFCLLSSPRVCWHFWGKSSAKRSAILHSRPASIRICIKSRTALVQGSLTDVWMAPFAGAETVTDGTAHDFGRVSQGTSLESGNSRMTSRPRPGVKLGIYLLGKPGNLPGSTSGKIGFHCKLLTNSANLWCPRVVRDGGKFNTGTSSGSSQTMSDRISVDRGLKTALIQSLTGRFQRGIVNRKGASDDD